MAVLRPFRGLAFDPRIAGPLGDLVAPCADAIDGEMSESLHARSPHNVVRIAAGRIGPADSASDNRFTRARTLMIEWQKKGILRRDAEPTFYLHEGEHDERGAACHRMALMGLLRIEEAGPGTHAAPPSRLPSQDDPDRLVMACHAHASPAVVLVSDEDGAFYDLCDRMRFDADDQRGEWRDGDSVLHRLKTLHGAAYRKAVDAALSGKALALLDGQATLQSARRYLDWAIARNPDVGLDSPERYVLAALLSSRDPGYRPPGDGPPKPRLPAGLVIHKIDAESL